MQQLVAMHMKIIFLLGRFFKGNETHNVVAQKIAVPLLRSELKDIYLFCYMLKLLVSFCPLLIGLKVSVMKNWVNVKNRWDVLQQIFPVCTIFT